jgi:hypothetical protein
MLSESGSMPTRFSGANSTLGLGHEIRGELPGLALHPGARASYPLRQASLNDVC